MNPIIDYNTLLIKVLVHLISEEIVDSTILIHLLVNRTKPPRRRLSEYDANWMCIQVINKYTHDVYKDVIIKTQLIM